MTERSTAAAPRRWLAHPVLAALVAVVWLLLQGSLEPVHWIVAAVMGVAIPRLAWRFLGPGTRVRAIGTALRLVFVVFRDIVVANVTVARIVLNPRSNPRPGWVEVPLDVEHPSGIVLLATIITTTPGTVSCVIEEERRRILVHALDCDDAHAMAAQIKSRYEAPLRRIFDGAQAQPDGARTRP